MQRLMLKKKQRLTEDKNTEKFLKKDFFVSAEKFAAEKNYIITPRYIILYYIILYYIILYFIFYILYCYIFFFLYSGRSYTNGKSNDLYQEIYKKPWSFLPEQPQIK